MPTMATKVRASSEASLHVSKHRGMFAPGRRTARKMGSQEVTSLACR